MAANHHAVNYGNVNIVRLQANIGRDNDEDNSSEANNFDIPPPTANNSGTNAAVELISDSKQATTQANVGDVCNAEWHFTANDQTLKALIALCYGVKNEAGELLLDMGTEPWALLAPNLRPKGVDYRSEIN